MLVTMVQPTGIIAMDMDGTLLTPAGEIPPGFWEVAHTLQEQGWVLVPASGRQLATLEAQFAPAGTESIIAENGAVVSHAGSVISTTPLDTATAAALIQEFRRGGWEGGVIVCSAERAVTDNADPDFLACAAPYYRRLDVVADALDYCDPADPDAGIIKVAIYSPENVETAIGPHLAAIAEPATHMAVSGQHWLDFMDPQVSKGNALAILAQQLGVDLAQTIAFGDFLNDYALLETAGTAYAMTNAHPRLKAIATAVIGSNAEYAVVRTLEQLAAGTLTPPAC